MSVSFGLPFLVIVDLALKFIIHNLSQCADVCTTTAAAAAHFAHTRCERETIRISIYYYYSYYFAVQPMFIMFIIVYMSIRSMWFAFGTYACASVCTDESKSHIFSTDSK